MIKVGDFVIINHIDMPSAHLVALVTDILPIDPRQDFKDPRNRRLICAHYLSESVSINYVSGETWSVTSIKDFGVMINFDSNYSCYHIIKNSRNSESIATYRDGRIRQWQESLPSNIHQIKKSARKEIIKIQAKEQAAHPYFFDRASFDKPVI